MPVSHPILHDVVIAGAGPVGLFLACELRLAGVGVLVLEQAASPLSPLKALPFGLRGLSAATLEAFHRRGLLDEIEAARRASDAAGAIQSSAHWMQQPRPQGGHFAGMPFLLEDVDASRWPRRLSSRAGFHLALDLQSLENVLAARAIALGAGIRRGLGVEDFEQQEDRVVVRGGGRSFAARWLVGCDGGRSRVRRIGGFDFVGTDPEFTGYSIQAELVDPDVLNPGRTYTPAGMYTYARPGTIAMVDFDGGACHRLHPITPGHVQSVLRRVSGTGVSVDTLHLASTWTDRARQAASYRKGRVLLAGDAAHIHSPLGGQGLNLGLGDAMNLGWKLAATIRGEAPAALLDSYFTERHAEGARILDWSRAQVALMRPTPGTRALAGILRDLIGTRDGATYFAERVWGLSLRYDLGDPHPLVGRSAPDFELAGGATLGELLRPGKGLLLDFDAQAPLQALASRLGSQITYVARDAKDRLGLRAVLVRPDGFVAWVGETPLDAAGAIEAASQWVREIQEPA